MFLQIRAFNAAGVDELLSNLGTDDAALKTKLDAELAKQYMTDFLSCRNVRSYVTQGPLTGSLSGSGLLSATWALVFTAPVVAHGLLV